ncbi:MAG: exodeoxyribonuclease VII large subunit [Acidimicrobiales bacterium]
MRSEKASEPLRFELFSSDGAVEDATESAAAIPEVSPSAQHPAVMPALSDVPRRNLVALPKAPERAFREPVSPRPAHSAPPATPAPPAPGAVSDAAISVSELYERVSAALQDEFGGRLWVVGEVRKVTSSATGHRFIELSDRQGGATGPDRSPGRYRQAAPANLDVACWARDWPSIAAELEAVGIELVPGLVVRVRGSVGVWQGASKLRFSMDLLDVEALVGGIAASRRRLLQALEREALLEANRRLPVPLVPMRVGLVTSAGGEAYRDFMGQLDRSGFAFDTRFEPALVQGAAASAQVALAIERLQGFEPDVIVVVRGGGAKGDLAAFDSEEVARAIATSCRPVWTGIGHTGDRSVADEVAQRSLITPTACGEAIVEAVGSFFDGLVERATYICEHARRTPTDAIAGLSQAAGRLTRASRHQLDRSEASVARAAGRAQHCGLVTTEQSTAAMRARAHRLAGCGRLALAESASSLGHRQDLLRAFDLHRQLARGWSLTRGADGRVLRSVKDAAPGAEIVSVLSDGAIASRVTGEPAQGGG